MSALKHKKVSPKQQNWIFSIISPMFLFSCFSSYLKKRFLLLVRRNVFESLYKMGVNFEVLFEGEVVIIFCKRIIFLYSSKHILYIYVFSYYIKLIK